MSQITVIAEPHYPGCYRVEHIVDDGAVEMAIFTGGNNEARANQYARELHLAIEVPKFLKEKWRLHDEKSTL